MSRTLDELELANIIPRALCFYAPPYYFAFSTRELRPGRGTKSVYLSGSFEACFDQFNAPLARFIQFQAERLAFVELTGKSAGKY